MRLYFVFYLRQCIQLQDVGTSFQLTLIFFYLIEFLFSFHLHKSAYALPLTSKC
jgi:hypothetical protein